MNIFNLKFNLAYFNLNKLSYIIKGHKNALLNFAKKKYSVQNILQALRLI